MKPKSIFALLIFALCIKASAQTPIALQGRVVEILQDKTKPLAGVVVSVSGESYDVTGPDGSFKLHAPKGLDFVTVTVKGSEKYVISPFEGKISLPPMSQPIEIQLCNENNKKLLAKVQDLNTRIKSLQKSQRLSARQVELLHKTMLDTIEHYQSLVDDFALKLKASEKENLSLKLRIEELEKKNTLLEEKLFLALGEKYSEQQKAYTAITALLNIYCSRIKDLHHAIPGDAIACAKNTPQACVRFYSTVDKYNQARNAINENRNQHLTSVQHHWTNPEVALQLEKTYTYLLDQIHLPLLFEKMNSSIIDPLKARSQGNSKEKTVVKQISSEGGALAQELKPMTIQLDEMKSKLYNLLSNSIQ